MKLGVFIPTYLLPGEEDRHGDQIRRFAVHSEDLGQLDLFAKHLPEPFRKLHSGQLG